MGYALCPAPIAECVAVCGGASGGAAAAADPAAEGGAAAVSPQQRHPRAGCAGLQLAGKLNWSFNSAPAVGLTCWHAGERWRRWRCLLQGQWAGPWAASVALAPGRRSDASSTDHMWGWLLDGLQEECLHGAKAGGLGLVSRSVSDGVALHLLGYVHALMQVQGRAPDGNVHSTPHASACALPPTHLPCTVPAVPAAAGRHHLPNQHRLGGCF